MYMFMYMFIVDATYLASWMDRDGLAHIIHVRVQCTYMYMYNNMCMHICI